MSRRIMCPVCREPHGVQFVLYCGCNGNWDAVYQNFKGWRNSDLDSFVCPWCHQSVTSPNYRSWLDSESEYNHLISCPFYLAAVLGAVA